MNSGRKRVLNILPLPAFLFLASCTHTFKEYQKDVFGNYRWTNDASVNFTPLIEDTTRKYRVSIGLRHLYGIQDKQINIKLSWAAPDGASVQASHTIQLRKANGDYVSSCGGDLCDIEVVVLSAVQFDQPGEYEMTIALDQPDNVLGVMEVGLIIDTVD